MIRQHFESSRKKWLMVMLLLTGCMLLIFLLSISLGSVSIPIREVLNYLTGFSTGQNSWDIILGKFRIPKALTGILVGASLGVSGLQMQTLFRNPLAGPYILGISSGAGLGVAIMIFLGFQFGSFMEWTGMGRNWLLVISAASGAFLILLVIVSAANRVKDAVTLLIIGLMIGTASGAIVSILQFFSQAENIQAYVIWSFGSLGSLSWEELSLFTPVLLVGLIFAYLLSKPLNGLLLGERYAESLGINISRIRLLVILNTSLLAGTVTAFCGPIAFVGIAVPHLVRMLFNTVDHRLLTPLIILFGGTLVITCDLIAQLPGMEATLPINAVTAIFGAPFVVFLLLRGRNLNYTYKS